MPSGSPLGFTYAGQNYFHIRNLLSVVSLRTAYLLYNLNNLNSIGVFSRYL